MQPVGMSVRRYDAAQYRKPEKLANGFLKADAVLSRTGIFTYQLGDGTTRRELRLPEEVFNADSMKSFEMLPVTDDHPAEPVTADNATKYTRGSVGSDIRQDGELLCASTLITDAALVKQVLSGKKDQLSNGYDCDLEMTPGVHPKFGKYDAIQRNIRGNHVAVVKTARAGPVARLRLDSGDAVLVPGGQSGPDVPDPAATDPELERPSTTALPPSIAPGGALPPGDPDDLENEPVQPGPEPSVQPTDAENASMNKIKIDGVEYLPEQLPAVLAKRDAEVKAKHEAEIAVAAKARKDAEDALAASKSELDKANAKADGLKSDLDKATKARADAEDPKKFAAAVQARVAILSKATAVLGAEAKLDELDAPAIRAEVLKKLDPKLNLDGKSADYIEARFDHAIEAFEAEKSGLAALRRDANPLPRPGATAGSDEHPRDKFIRETEQAYRQPLRNSRANPKG